MDPTKCFPSHPSEEILEEYIFHRLPESLTAQVEEHLLICHSCQDAVEKADRFVSDLKAAARQPAPHVSPVRSGWRLSATGASVAAVLALAILASLASLTVRKRAQEPPSAPVAVSLSSVRGTDPLSPAPAGKPLQLSIEAPDLVSGREYRVEVVDAIGRPVWKGAVTETGGELVAHMPKPLGTGVYWVRLYGTDSDLLREFGLSVK